MPGNLIPFAKAAADMIVLRWHKDDLPVKKMKEVRQVLKDKAEAEELTAISSERKGFRYRFVLSLDPDDKMRKAVIQLWPNNLENAHAAMTVQWNPARLLKTHRETLLAMFQDLFGSDFRRLMMAAGLEDIDVAIDFPVAINDIAFEVREKNTAMTWGIKWANKAVVQTIYCGTTDQVKAYDKGAEQSAKTKTWDTKLVEGAADEEGQRMRVEARISLHGHSMPLNRLGEVRDPFQGVHIYSYKNVAAAFDDSPEDKLFLLAVKHLSLPVALGVYGRTQREKKRRALVDCHVEWWNEKVFGNALITAVKGVRLLPDDAFDPKAQTMNGWEKLYQLDRKAGKK